MKNYFWNVRLSYLAPPAKWPQNDGEPRRWRQNAQIGIVAPDITSAIQAAMKAGVPEGGSEPIVWSVNHSGAVGFVVEDCIR